MFWTAIDGSTSLTVDPELVDGSSGITRLS
jgi:hypothetical protein